MSGDCGKEKEEEVNKVIKIPSVRICTHLLGQVLCLHIVGRSTSSVKGATTVHTVHKVYTVLFLISICTVVL